MEAGDVGGGSLLELELCQMDEMVAHCLKALPYEGCGLLVGELATGRVRAIVPTRNAAMSSRLYEVDPLELLRADRAAEGAGLSIVGVFHSHTHTDPYPSPTDVGQAPDPTWHYVLVSLRHEVASVRSYRIVDGLVTEEPIVAPVAGDEPGPARDVDARQAPRTGG